MIIIRSNIVDTTFWFWHKKLSMTLDLVEWDNWKKMLNESRGGSLSSVIGYSEQSPGEVKSVSTKLKSSEAAIHGWRSKKASDSRIVQFEIEWSDNRIHKILVSIERSNIQKYLWTCLGQLFPGREKFLTKINCWIVI